MDRLEIAKESKPFKSHLGAELVVVAVDLEASEPGVVLVIATVVDLVSSSATLRASSIDVAIMPLISFHINLSCDLYIACAFPNIINVVFGVDIIVNPKS